LTCVTGVSGSGKSTLVDDICAGPYSGSGMGPKNGLALIRLRGIEQLKRPS
jgi:excinuclease UvrABC ATPase subunit